jgi:hypothetical protein
MAASKSIQFSIAADEIVAPGTPIEIALPAAVDDQAAQAAVRVVRGCDVVPAQVRLARKGRAIVVSLEDTGAAAGAFTLEVGELLGTRGQRLGGPLRLPFAVFPSAGKVRSELRVEHAARLVVGELEVTRLAPGQAGEGGHVDVMKAVHRRTGAMSEIAFDERGKAVDLRKRLAELERRRLARYGKLHPTLFERLERAKHNERFAVVLWPPIVLPPAPYEKPADRRSVEPPEGEAKVLKSLRKAVDGLGAALRRCRIALPRQARRDDLPFLRLQATPAQLRQLARDRAVGSIQFDDRTAFNDLGASIAVARSNGVHALGFDGTGIRVAVFEDGPSNTTNLQFAARFDNSPPASAHARLTSAVIKNVEPNLPHGHAPDCDLYSANSNDNDALRWAIRDQHCTVVSQSFHRGSEPGGAGLQADDLLKDWLALRWPYPTIVQAAGNFWQGDADNIQPPADEYVNHKGYNTLAVGNHDDTAAAMSADSVFRNPSSTHGDRELPEIAANGTVVSAVGESMSGTSFAAPAAAGVVALLQDVDGTLCSWPEGCRAILLASAGRNVRGGTWWQDVVSRVDGRDGAGAVDARAGVAIAQQRRSRNAPASRHGWDVGTLSSSVVGSDGLATFRYRVVVPRFLFSARVKVALAWDSAVTSILGIPLASTLTVDLDLSVRNGAGATVASSASWDNSYEVVEFDAARGETYEIVIRRWSGTDSVWYGVAWTVTGASLFVEADQLAGLERVQRAGG